MSTILIIILLAVIALVIASLAVGRSTHEVESARDTEYLELEGAWVRYNVIGGGPPVVLVHGWLSSSAVWDDLAHRLSQRFTVYTLDMPGFGESDKPLDGYGVRYGSRMLYAFCAHFGLTRVNIIGHDLGGDMVMKLACDHPDVAGRIVLVGTPANEDQIDLPTSLWAATLPVVGPLFYALGRSVRPVRSAWMKAFVSEPGDITEEMLDDAANSTPAAMSKTLSVSRREIGGGRLARQSRMVRVPVLVITGEEDQIVDPQAAGVWSKSLDQAEVCLMDECGHMPMIERTGEFNAQILAFLTGDARYLEYAEQRTRQEDPEVDMEEDTIEVGTLPPDDEDPAFGEPNPARNDDTGSSNLFSPGSRRRNRSEDRKSRRDHGEIPRPGQSGDDPEDQTDDFGDYPGYDVTDEREVRDRSESGDTDFGLAPSRSGGRDSDNPFVSGDDTRNREPAGEDDPPEDEGRMGGLIRRFGGRSSRPSERRHNRPWNFDDDKTDEDPESPREEHDPDLRAEGDFGRGDEPNPDYDHDAGGDYAGDDTSESSRFRETFMYREEPGTSGSETENTDSSTDSSYGEHPEASEPPPEPRRRRDYGEGTVPEVPDGLFDWGNSLDDFEPVDRNNRVRRRRRSRETGDFEDVTGQQDEPRRDADPRNPDDDREDDFRI